MKQIQFDGGVLQRHEDFDFGPLAPRFVDVWLPPGYEAGEQRHPVLYLHDGQNVFTPGESSIDIDWGIDEAVVRLIKHDQIVAPVVVGIWNTRQRLEEYLPQKPSQAGQMRTRLVRIARMRGGFLSDAYLDFLVHQVKPFIDGAYRTLPDRANTVTMGSSMGGLISLYALEQYPDVFGGAGCVSTHWTAGRNWLVHTMGQALPQASGGHRLYFDYGTVALDGSYEPYQRRMDEYVRAAGYQQGKDWLTLKFEGADHSERAWRERVHLPLQFLLGPKT